LLAATVAIASESDIIYDAVGFLIVSLVELVVQHLVHENYEYKMTLFSSFTATILRRHSRTLC
jgi:hypothetical protein